MAGIATKHMARHRPRRLGDMSWYICVVHGSSVTVTVGHTMVCQTQSPREEAIG
jgi:hypothetical protein